MDVKIEGSTPQLRIMPWTFSHPLAVIPFRKSCPSCFNFAPLVVGSLSPDFGYYVGCYQAAGFAHTIPGTFAICLPTGLLALGLFYTLRRPLCFVLPQPHRAALSQLAPVTSPRSVAQSILVATGSVLVGAWTHTVWDSFTHEGGWFVQRLSILRTPLIRIYGTELQAWYVLQQASTVVGFAALVAIYLIWLGGQPHAPRIPTEAISDGWRYAILGANAALSLAIAVPSAIVISSESEGFNALRVFFFRTAVYATIIFLPLVVIASIVLFSIERLTREGK